MTSIYQNYKNELKNAIASITLAKTEQHNGLIFWLNSENLIEEWIKSAVLILNSEFRMEMFLRNGGNIMQIRMDLNTINRNLKSLKNKFRIPESMFEAGFKHAAKASQTIKEEDDMIQAAIELINN